MRIPIAVSLESRDGSVSKDAKVVNAVLEARGDQPVLRKRPGVADVGQIWTSGTAQLLYPWNGLWAIYGDTLFNGTQSTIITPTFGTWNASDKGSAVTLSNGNLTASFAVSSNILVRANISKTVGKFYWEVTVGLNFPIIGIAKSTAGLTNLLGHDANGWGYYGFNGNMVNNNVSSAYGSSYTAGDIIGVALDLDNGLLNFAKNGVWQGQAFSGLSGTLFPAASGSTGEADTVTVNFGATAFTYTPPSGYTAGIAALGTSLGPTAGGLRFDAQEVGASAGTQLMMVKNRTQAWTIDRAGTKTLISFPSSMGAATYSVSSLTRSGSTATATVPTDPGVSIGDSITVAGASDPAYDVTATVTAISPGIAAAVIPISITRSGTTATAVSAIQHGLISGTAYAISGATQTGYNGTFTITVVDVNTFTFTVALTPASPATGSPTVATWYDSSVYSGDNRGPSGSTVVRLSTYFGNTIFNGESVTVVWSAGMPWSNGTYTVQNRTAAGFELVVASASGTNIQGGVLGTLTRAGVPAISSITRSNTTATITFGSAHIFQSGSTTLTISGAAQSEYNITNVVATPTSTTATYTVVDNTATPATGSPVVTRPVTASTVSYTVAGSPASPASGVLTLTTNGGMVPGLPYIDGYFFVMDNNGVMWQSSIDAPATFPALSNLTAQSENGKGKALARSLNYLIAFKEWDTEFFYDAKQQNFSFLPVDNGFTEVGCATGDSVAHIDGNLAWLSQVKERGRSIHLMTGLQQQKVSTPDVERILNNDDLATVYAYGIKLGGHSLYLLTLVTSNLTLVYDLSSQAWYQWTSLTLGASKSVTSITRDGTTATVTTSASHGLSDGDPAKLAGSAQTEYNGIFQITYVSPTVFTIQVTGSPATPATGTITATSYTSSYFKFTKYADFLGANLFLHESNGHLYQMLPTLYQDAGIPIDLMFRTSRLDGGSSEVKVMSRLSVIGDAIADTLMIRQSDDDCATFDAYRPVDLSNERPSLRRLGKFRRRTIEGRHIGNTNPRIEAIELEIPGGP